jgi:hypothetical protein
MRLAVADRRTGARSQSERPGSPDATRLPLQSPIAQRLEFVSEHCPHGTLTCDATAPAWNGYRLTVACPCGVVFELWVTSEEADADLLRLASLN